MLMDFRDDGGDLIGRQVPVYFEVAGVDLLQDFPPAPGEPPVAGTPLLVARFATLGLLSLRFAYSVGAATVALDEYAFELLLREGGGQVLIHPTLHRLMPEWALSATVQIPYNRLLSAWEEFAERVRITVLDRH